MSDNIPIEILEVILKRLPVRSLIQFRTVCKAWKSLIDSSDFITGYDTQLQHLLVSYEDADEDAVNVDREYVSIVDDHTFPQQRVSPAIPLLVSMFQFPTIIGISKGLLCLFGHGLGRDIAGLGKDIAVLWNVSISKAVAVVVPNVGCAAYDTVFGFGVCGETWDPKIVKIRDIPDSIMPWQVEVFTLSTGTWRSPYGSIFLRKSIRLLQIHVAVDGFLYWLAVDFKVMDGSRIAYNLIISFDLSSEEFKEVNLPHSLAHHRNDLYISKLRKSLVVLEENQNETVVWILEDGVSETFTKLFTIHTRAINEAVLKVLEFKKTGEPVIEYRSGLVEGSSLVVYDPHLKHFNNVEISERDSLYSVYAYTETLLLVDHPEFAIYNRGKRCSLMRGANNTWIL